MINKMNYNNCIMNNYSNSNYNNNNYKKNLIIIMMNNKYNIYKLWKNSNK